MKKLILVAIFTITYNTIFAQSYDSKPLLDSLKNKMNKVNDYSADVTIKLNVSFIKIPIKKATIFYKKPDKIKMRAKKIRPTNAANPRRSS